MRAQLAWSKIRTTRLINHQQRQTSFIGREFYQIFSIRPVNLKIQDFHDYAPCFLLWRPKTDLLLQRL